MLWPVSSGWAGLLCVVPGACSSHGSGAGGRVWVDPRCWGSAQQPGARREMSLRALLAGVSSSIISFIQLLGDDLLRTHYINY